MIHWGERPQQQQRRDLGLLLVVAGAAAFAFGTLGFSIIPFIMLICGLVSVTVGLVLARPTGRTLVVLTITVVFVTLPAWLWLLLLALSD